MENLTLGIRAFQKGRYKEAYEKLSDLAEQGEIRAQVILARLYYAGNGVPMDRDKYVYWLGRAAENGDKAAKSQLKRLAQEKKGRDD